MSKSFTHLPYILVFNYFAGRDHPVSNKVLIRLNHIFTSIYYLHYNLFFNAELDFEKRKE